jgi:translocation and assembly module TamB
MRAAPSRFRDVGIDTLFTAGRFEGRALQIDTLLLASDQADIAGGGSLEADGKGLFRFRSHVNDARPLKPIIGFDALSGDVAGLVSGTVDSLEIQAELQLDTLAFIGIGAPSAEGDLAVQLVHGRAYVTARVDLQTPHYPPLILDSARARIEYRDGPVDVDATLFVREDVVGKVKTHVESDSVLRLVFPSIELLVRGREWSNGQDTARVVVDRRGITVRDVSLRHGEGELRASGFLAPDSGSDFRASIRNLELESIRLEGDSTGTVGGLAGAGMVLHGGTSRPAIAARVNVQGLKYSGYQVGDVDGEFQYTDSTLRWDLDCVLAGGDTTTLEGLIPLGESESVRSGPALERTGFLRIKSSRLDLAPFRSFIPMAGRFEGLLSGELTLSQSAGRREFSGRIRLDSAEVRSDGFGIAYDSISAVVVGRGDSLCLESVVLRSAEGGRLTATGALVFPRGVSTLDGAVLHGNLFARNFVVAKARDYELKTEGDLEIDRTPDSTSIRGSLDIDRCRVWLPVFLDQFRSTPQNTTLPLLVAATQRRDTLREVTPVQAMGQDSVRSDRGRVGGRVRVNIPRNTWLQSPEINVEISGTLDLVPRRNSVEVFGHVTVERGSFNMYGKKFTFVSGRVDFEGGQTVDPNLILEVKYSYRGPEKNQEEIRLDISGTASKPILEFTKNGERISNANAVSYVMFGRSLDELSQDQKSTIAGSTNDLAQGMASSVLSNQLSNTVGKSLGLDVIEVSLQDNWRAAYLTAGKYVSERLYVRYTKGFQPEESGDAMEEVALEYEPFRPFLVQLIQGTSKTTGLNVFIILK